MGAPIMNNGYYDVPIHNQYSNKPYPRDNISNVNDYNFNQKIAVTMNDNKENYRYNQRPTVPSTSLYYESSNQPSGYYQDPISLSSDANTPLMKKKEQQICNYINTPQVPQFNSIESFSNGASLGNGGHSSINYSDPIINTGQYTQMTYPRYINNENSGYLNTQAMPNVSRNYWDYNDPSYSNYTFIPQPEYNNTQQVIPQQELPQQRAFQQVMPQQRSYQQVMPQQRLPQQVYINPHEVKIDTLKEDIKVIMEEDKKNKKNKKNNKSNKSNKKNTKPIEPKTLWNIIIVLILIIIFFIGKTLYDNKIISFKK